MIRPGLGATDVPNPTDPVDIDGKAVYGTHCTDNSMEEMIFRLNEHRVNELQELLDECLVSGREPDATCDGSMSRTLAVTLRMWMKDRKVRSHLLRLLECGGKAHDIADGMLSTILSKNTEKSGCGAFDTCSVNFGEISGLVEWLKKFNPHAIYMKCSGHDLQSVMTESANETEVEEECVITNFFDLLQAKLMKGVSSYVAKGEISKVADEVGEDDLQPGRFSWTWWLSRGAALHKFHRMYKLVCIFLKKSCFTQY
jgi:hypothetical protein